jgi:hypothetical protein
MKTGPLSVILLIFSFSFFTCTNKYDGKSIREWAILPDDHDSALKDIEWGTEYHVNHLHPSHQIIMNLKDLPNPSIIKPVTNLATRTHENGIFRENIQNNKKI